MQADWAWLLIQGAWPGFELSTHGTHELVAKPPKAVTLHSLKQCGASLLSRTLD
jgi:hypothetical protein